jgi:hypothetical protein
MLPAALSCGQITFSTRWGSSSMRSLTDVFSRAGAEAAGFLEKLRPNRRYPSHRACNICSDQANDATGSAGDAINALSKRLLVPAVRVAVLSDKLIWRRSMLFLLRTFDYLMAQATLHEEYPSRRPCPDSGGSMACCPRGFSALTGKYQRRCKSCSYSDSRSVKMIKQI